jgi:hypothetical protein
MYLNNVKLDLWLISKDIRIKALAPAAYCVSPGKLKAIVLTLLNQSID